jgi:prepilin-type N-terminal cleavage/methylation domain-containing protein
MSRRLFSPPGFAEAVARGHRVRGRTRKSAGFTLLELVIVIAIVLVLTALGIGMSRDIIPRFRTLRGAKVFSAKAQQCRALAIRTGKECAITLVSYDSALTDVSTNDGYYTVALGDSSRDSSTWDYLPPDPAGGGTDDSEGLVDIGDEDGQYYLRRVGLGNWGTITGPNTGNSNRIVFDARGFVSNPVGDFGSLGYITVTFVNKMASAQGRTENFTVRVARSGMTRVDSNIADEFNGLQSGTAGSSTTP